MTVTDPYTGIGVITRGVFDSDMAAISLSLHSSCNDIALNEKNSPSFCQIHFYRGIFHLLSSCTLSTLRAFNSSSFHPSSPQIHPFSMIPVTPHVSIHAPVWVRPTGSTGSNCSTWFQFTHPCGCDRCGGKVFHLRQRFNSRTRVGATLPIIIKYPLPFVSIHAPVWVRPCTTMTSNNPKMFQFTHPCGCDRADPVRGTVFQRFNSRTRVGATVGIGVPFHF